MFLPMMTPAQVLDGCQKLDTGGVINAALDSSAVSEIRLKGLAAELENLGFKVLVFSGVPPDNHQVCAVKPNK